MSRLRTPLSSIIFVISFLTFWNKFYRKNQDFYAFEDIPPELLDPDHEAGIKDIKNFNWGFRESRSLVTKNDEIEADFERVPEKYHLKASQVSSDKLIEGPILSKPKSCKDTEIIIMIKSAVTHPEFRTTIRKTWATNLEMFKTAIYFTVAKSSNSHIQAKLLEESETFKDVIIGDFQDSYYNVTKKVFAGMNFVVENCKYAHYVIHIDDDAYVSLPRLYDFLLRRVQETEFSTDNYIF